MDQARAGRGSQADPSRMNPVFLARSKFRRRKYEECIEICDRLLAENGLDMAVWFLKTRALTMMDYVDDTDMEEEGIAEILMDDNAIARAPRPGTSLKRPMTQSARPGSRAASGPNQSVRPLSRTGRPLSGFARPGSSAVRRPGTGSVSVNAAFRGGSRAGTARPLSSAGRFVRLGTQSMLSKSDRFIDPDRLNLPKYARRPSLAMALCDYLIYSDKNPKKALELCALSTQTAQFKDPWWKSRLAKCYYQLGMYREAEKQFQSAIRQQPMIVTYLELAKVYVRLDQPNTALDIYLTAAERFSSDTALPLGQARIYDMINDVAESVAAYKAVLAADASNCEAIACLASHYFYDDQPEIALRFYRRLLQMGINNTELWNNMALCCFYSGQFDMCLGCFERALLLAEDEEAADVWYNISHVAVGIGDQNLAYRALKVAVSHDGKHAESFCNLGILNVKKQQFQKARSAYLTANKQAPHLFEPSYNLALLASKMGDYQESYARVKQSLDIFPDHKDSSDLKAQLEKHFTVV